MSWLCEWCAIYGVYPVSKAYRPDDEEPVLTVDGKKICEACAMKYRKVKQKADAKET